MNGNLFESLFALIYACLFFDASLWFVCEILWKFVVNDNFVDILQY